MIVATGPLTSEALSADIARLVGAEHLYFYDAISPIVLAETIDRGKVFRQSRWDRSLSPAQSDAATDARATTRRPADRPAASTTGEGDYLNCPMTREEYERFYDALDPRRVGDRPRLRQGEVLRRLPADRGDGAPRRGHAALRADEAGRSRRSANGPRRRTRPCSCGRTTWPAITTASSGFRRRSNGASRRACCG